MATFTDDFNRADESPITGDWTNTAGTIRILSQQVRGNGAESIAIVSGSSFDDNQSATVEFTTLVNSDLGGVGVRVDTNGDGYILQWPTSNSSLVVNARVGGSSTALFTRSVGSVLTVGDTITLDVTGNVLSCFRNGVQVGASYTDASSTFTSGSPAIWYSAQNVGGTRLDNFSAEGMASAASITDVDTDNIIVDGQTGISLTVAGFSGDITGVNLKVGSDTVALTNLAGSGNSYTFDLMDVTALADGAAVLPFSSGTYQNEIEVTDGTDTASINITRNIKAGYAIVVTLSAVTTKGSVYEGRVGGAPADGWQNLYPTANNTLISATGIITSDGATVSGQLINTSSDQVELWDITFPSTGGSSLASRLSKRLNSNLATTLTI